MTEGESAADARPALVVVHGGEPSAEEIAALVVAIGALTTDPPETASTRPGWADRRSALRRPLEHGPGRWVASTQPGH